MMHYIPLNDEGVEELDHGISIVMGDTYVRPAIAKYRACTGKDPGQYDIKTDYYGGWATAVSIFTEPSRASDEMHAFVSTDTVIRNRCEYLQNVIYDDEVARRIASRFSRYCKNLFGLKKEDMTLVRYA